MAHYNWVWFGEFDCGGRETLQPRRKLSATQNSSDPPGGSAPAKDLRLRIYVTLSIVRRATPGPEAPRENCDAAVHPRRRREHHATSARVAQTTRRFLGTPSKRRKDALP